MVDLHSHSTASDGSLSPGALVELAHERGLSALALTDHDSVAGWAEAAERAERLGLRFIRGLEIEIGFKPGEFHLLGLDLNPDCPELRESLRGLSLAREERNRAILELMRSDGLAVDYDQFTSLFPPGPLGRPHIAAYLVKLGLVKRRQLAFDRYLARGRPYYQAKRCLGLEEAIELIHQSGGLAFVAHPMSLFVSWKRLHELFPQWKELGIDGVEAWHPTARKSECQRLDAIARELGLAVSAGSDFHGEVRPERRLGHSAGDMIIDDSFLDCLNRAPPGAQNPKT